MRVVDFYSDTRTLPTPEMRRAMAEAEVGDDVSRQDPTVSRMEEMAADRMGKEAALFVSSGTQGNLVSILTHCQRGDDIIVADNSHIFRGEAGGASALGGISYHTLPTDKRGMLDPDEVAGAVKPTDVHYPHTAMVALENTHNSRGGIPLTPEDTKTIADVAHSYDIPMHIDGARIFNASVYLETPVSELVKDADSVTFCLSKGLGCPVGSVICGTNEFIDRARFWRKMVGGGMRQAGIIAAAGIVALETMVTRLAEDHSNARRLAQGLSKIPGISIDPDSLPTNLVFFEITNSDPGELSRRLEKRGIMGGGPQKRWRFVTHNGITGDDVDYALDVVESTFKEYSAV